MSNGFAKMEIETGNEKYIKIKDGEAVQFHILSKEPGKVLNHWVSKKKNECLGNACEYCAQGDKPKVAWKVKVWDRKNLAVKDYEFGPSVAIQIKNIAEILAENQQTIDDIDLRVKREGSSQFDTEYFVNQVPAKDPIPEEARKISEVPF